MKQIHDGFVPINKLISIDNRGRWQRVDADGQYESPNVCYALGFQTAVSIMQAPGVEGDFCDHNPRTTVDAGPGGLVAHADGVIIGHFAWLEYSATDPNGSPAIARSRGTGGPPAGFVHREQQGVFAPWYPGATAASGMMIPGGFMVTLHQEGGFFVKNNGTGYAQVGMKAFAKLSDGGVVFAAAGTAPGAASVTGSIAASTFSVTGTITGNIANVTAVGSGTVVPGATVTGTGVATGTKIVGQLTPLLAGEALGGIGRYYVNIGDQAVASTTLSGTYGTMTVTAVGSGALEVGDVLSGTGVTAGTQISALGTGAGGTGTYIVDQNAVVASTTIAATDAIETKWFASSAGPAGALIKMTSWPLG
jgi:hypothetical protein